MPFVRRSFKLMAALESKSKRLKVGFSTSLNSSRRFLGVGMWSLSLSGSCALSGPVTTVATATDSTGEGEDCWPSKGADDFAEGTGKAGGERCAALASCNSSSNLSARASAAARRCARELRSATTCEVAWELMETSRCSAWFSASSLAEIWSHEMRFVCISTALASAASNRWASVPCAAMACAAVLDISSSCRCRSAFASSTAASRMASDCFSATTSWSSRDACVTRPERFVRSPSAVFAAASATAMRFMSPCFSAAASVRPRELSATRAAKVLCSSSARVALASASAMRLQSAAFSALASSTTRSVSPTCVSKRACSSSSFAALASACVARSMRSRFSRSASAMALAAAASRSAAFTSSSPSFWSRSPNLLSSSAMRWLAASFLASAAAAFAAASALAFACRCASLASFASWSTRAVRRLARCSATSARCTAASSSRRRVDCSRPAAAVWRCNCSCAWRSLPSSNWTSPLKRAISASLAAAAKAAASAADRAASSSRPNPVARHSAIWTCSYA
mmetsp:Transcript_87890/g.253508  ORF Transcript_87890/g.253508 Transcript_87890/m.253508 type:complete len:514 (+) Transcript_87890:1128-2669(+)